MKLKLYFPLGEKKKTAELIGDNFGLCNVKYKECATSQFLKAGTSRNGRYAENGMQTFVVYMGREC
jgi:hypothetical protein